MTENTPQDGASAPLATPDTQDGTTPQDGPCAVFWEQHACCLDADHGRRKHTCLCGAKPAADAVLIGDDLHIGTPYAEGHR